LQEGTLIPEWLADYAVLRDQASACTGWECADNKRKTGRAIATGSTACLNHRNRPARHRIFTMSKRQMRFDNRHAQSLPQRPATCPTPKRAQLCTRVRDLKDDVLAGRAKAFGAFRLAIQG